MTASGKQPTVAVVAGATGAIGQAMVDRLRSDPGIDHIVALARSVDRLASLYANSDRITRLPCDITDEDCLARAVAATAGHGELRLLVIATGMLHHPGYQPERSWRKLDAAELQRNFMINSIGPAMLAKHFLPLVPRQGRSVIAALSARVGSIGDNRLGGWYGYRASKAALNQIIRCLAIDLGRTHPEAICVALHPGTVASPLSAPFTTSLAPERLFSPARAAAQLHAVLDSLTPAQSGGFFAWDGQPIEF